MLGHELNRNKVWGTPQKRHLCTQVVLCTSISAAESGIRIVRKVPYVVCDTMPLNIAQWFCCCCECGCKIQEPHLSSHAPTVPIISFIQDLLVACEKWLGSEAGYILVYGNSNKVSPTWTAGNYFRSNSRTHGKGKRNKNKIIKYIYLKKK